MRLSCPSSAHVLIALGLSLAVGACTILPDKTPPPTPEGQIEAEESAILSEFSPDEDALPPDSTEPTAGKPRSLLAKIFFWWPKGKPKPPKAVPLGVLGKVYLVNEPGGFVVIETSSVTSLLPGTILSTLKEGSVSSTVKVARERQQPFAIGEIQTGIPERGASLYLVK